MLWSDGTTKEEAREILLQGAKDEAEHTERLARDADHAAGNWEGCFCYECQCRLHAIGAYNMDEEV